MRVMGRNILHKAKTLAGIGWRRQALVAEACASMFAARMILLILPFPKVARRLGDFVAPADPRVAERAAATTPARGLALRRPSKAELCATAPLR